MISIDSDAAARTVPPLALVQALREGHRQDLCPEVERMLLSEPASANDFLVWGGWRRREGLAVKAASVFPGNAAEGRPNIHSVVLLFDGETGAPVAVIHGEAFTRMKTAAGSALAAAILSREDAGSLAVIGAGAQAETHIRFLLAVRPSIRRVTICNRTLARAEELAERIGSLGVEARASVDPAPAVEGADLVSCLTASPRPVLEGRWLRPGAHVDLVGGFTPAMREADDETVRRGRLFADTRRFTLTVCGDFSQPLAAGVIAESDILADLFELAGGVHPGRRSREEITVFKSGGGGHLDLMAARAIFDLHMQASAASVSL